MTRWILVLTLAGLCLGTDFWVTPTGDDDTCDGSSENSCLTIQKVVEDLVTSSGTHTIYVQSGTYSDSTGTSVTVKNAVNLNPVANGTTLTIEGYQTTAGDGHEADLGAARPRIATTSTAWCVLRSTAGTFDTGAVTVRNVDFSPTAQTGDFPAVSWGTEAGNGPDGDLTLEYCGFDPHTSTRGIVRTWSTAGGSSTRDVTVRNCSWTPNGVMNGSMFSVTEVGDVVVDGCTLGSNTEANAYFLQLLTSVGTVTVADTTGVFGNAGVVATWTGAGALAGLTDLTFKGNTLTTGGTHFLQLGSVTLQPRVTFHRNALTFKGDLTIGPGDDATPPADYGYVSMVGNTIRGISAGAADHGLAVMCGVVAGEVIGNVVVGDSAFEWAMVIKGSGLNVGYNTSIGKVAMLVTEGDGAKIHHNSLISNQTGGNALLLNRNVGNGLTDFPTHVSITDNVLIKGSGVYALYVSHYTDGAPDPAAYIATRCDRNHYLGGGGVVAYLNGAAVGNVATLPARWAAYGGHPHNDLESSEGDPKCVSATTGDLRLTLGSPLDVTGTLGGDLLDAIGRGAWPRVGPAAVVGNHGVHRSQ